MRKEKITDIKDPSFKTGMGKRGEWTMMKVIVESGDVVTVFAPAQVGDVVEMEYNDQYSSWNGKVIRPDRMGELIEMNKLILKQTQAIYKAVTGQELPDITQAPKVAPEAPTKAKDVVYEPTDDVDLSQIPF